MHPRAPHPLSGPTRADVPLEVIKQQALSRPATRGGLDRLRCTGVTVIAEADPAQPAAAALIARCEQAAVAAIAVPPGPAGDELGHVAGLSDRTGLPVLSLHQVDSGYRLWQARAYGAALVLLSAAQLAQQALVSLVERAESIGLGALVEVRDTRDLMRALHAQAHAVLLRRGPHARPEELHHLLAMVPAGIVRALESGPDARTDLIACARHGGDAVLLRRDALTGADPGAAVGALAAMGAHPSLARRNR